MLILRYIVEALGFLLLHACLAFAFSILYICVTFSYLYMPDGIYAAVLPAFVIMHAVISGALTLFFKWLIIGRFKPGTYPLYGTYVWRTELVERLEENVAQQSLYPLITGTVYMQLFFQAMGAKIGKRAYLDHPVFCEPDLVTVGDYVNIERTGTLQAHLFQDRVRTTGPIRIGHFCSIGSSAVVLIGGAMGDKACLSSLSMVMRSEELPPNSKWHGLPAKPQEDVDVDLAKMAHAVADDVEEDEESGGVVTVPHSPEELKEDPAERTKKGGEEKKKKQQQQQQHQKKDKAAKQKDKDVVVVTAGAAQASTTKYDVQVVVKEGDVPAVGSWGPSGKPRVVQGS
jgi:acetyltransferase-like isoleucine patch superfamily enzyme